MILKLQMLPAFFKKRLSILQSYVSIINNLYFFIMSHSFFPHFPLTFPFPTQPHMALKMRIFIQRGALVCVPEFVGKLLCIQLQGQYPTFILKCTEANPHTPSHFFNKKPNNEKTTFDA